MAKRKTKTKEELPLLIAPVRNQPITETIETNYMPYVMSVIISRAIPEIDGFKPAHRKLLYTMYKMGLMTGQRTKSTNVVGQTMRLNPHGDAAIYETMVRLTRDHEALLHPFIDSKGTFGKQYSTNMAYAAARYTEVKLEQFCAELFAGIDENAVDMIDNYDGSMLEPVLFPTGDDVAGIRARGIPRVWAWPYFLLDEADDGDVGPDGAMREMVQSEIRYIHRFVKTAEQIGFDGIIGNWSYLGHKAKALNTYAFGRFTADPAATPETVLKEFADNITCDGESSRAVILALKFIENNSNWQKKLPAKYRMPNFEIGAVGIDDVLSAVSDVKIADRPNTFALPESPADYFQKLNDRLIWIKNREQ